MGQLGYKGTIIIQNLLAQKLQTPWPGESSLLYSLWLDPPWHSLFKTVCPASSYQRAREANFTRASPRRAHFMTKRPAWALAALSKPGLIHLAHITKMSHRGTDNGFVWSVLLLRKEVLSSCLSAGGWGIMKTKWTSHGFFQLQRSPPFLLLKRMMYICKQPAFPVFHRTQILWNILKKERFETK